MTGVLGKIIKVFEVIVEMLKTLKNKFKKSTNEKRRGSGVLGGAVVVLK